MKSKEKKEEDKAVSEKDKYIEKRKIQIEKLNTEIVDLESKISTADVEANAKLEHEKIIGDLRQKRDDARTKLEEIKAAGDNKWEEAKDNLEGIWTNIKYGMKKLKAKF